MVLISLILSIIAGVAVGAAMAFADHSGFYLIVLVPIIGGVIVGTATFLPVSRQENPPTAPLVLAALIGALIAIGVYWYGQYTFYINDLVVLLQEQEPSATREEALEFIETILDQEYGQTGFMGFVADYAETGFSINRTVGSSSGGIDIQGTIAYIFWGVEALMLAAFAIITVVRRRRDALAKRPVSVAPAL